MTSKEGDSKGQQQRQDGMTGMTTTMVRTGGMAPPTSTMLTQHPHNCREQLLVGSIGV